MKNFSRTSPISLGILLAVISCVRRVAPAQPEPPTLGPEEHYAWSIRASHSDELLLPAGDSVDIVLLRDRCGADAGHGLKGCWDASTIDVTPKWQVGGRGVARVRPLPEGSWIFVAFYPSETGGKLVPRLGQLTDTLELHFVARRKP